MVVAAVCFWVVLGRLLGWLRSQVKISNGFAQLVSLMTPMINAGMVFCDRHCGGINYPVGGVGAITESMLDGRLLLCLLWTCARQVVVVPAVRLPKLPLYLTALSNAIHCFLQALL
jgi:hypothetical protein